MYKVRRSHEVDVSTMEVGDAKLSQPCIGNCDGFAPRAFAILETAQLHALVSTCPFSCSFGNSCRGSHLMVPVWPELYNSSNATLSLS